MINNEEEQDLYFEEIKKFAKNVRKWEIIIREDTEYTLGFSWKNRHEEKWFYLQYEGYGNKLNILTKPRPLYHHYYVHFEQENVWDCRGECLVTVFDDQWLMDEEEVIDWLRLCKRRGSK